MQYSRQQLENPHFLLHQLSDVKLKIGIAQSLLLNPNVNNQQSVIKHIVDIYENVINSQPRMYDLDIESNYVNGGRKL